MQNAQPGNSRLSYSRVIGQQMKGLYEGLYDQVVETLQSALGSPRNAIRTMLVGSTIYVAPNVLLANDQYTGNSGQSTDGSQVRDESLTGSPFERVIFGAERIGRGAGKGPKTRYYFDLLIPLNKPINKPLNKEGEGGDDLLFANIVPSDGQYGDGGSIFAIGYRRDFGFARAGFIPGVDVDHTNEGKTYAWPEFNFELDDISGTGFNVNGTYMWPARNKQRVESTALFDKYENPEERLVVEGSLPIGSAFGLDKDVIRALVGYDFGKDQGGLRAGLSIENLSTEKDSEKDGWQIGLSYERRSDGEDLFFLDARKWFGKGSNHVESKRTRWKRPRYSHRTVMKKSGPPPAAFPQELRAGGGGPP